MAVRILIFDDEEDILEVFRLILEPEGFEVHLFSHPFTDIQEIERLAPDLIILDLVMDHQQGGELMLQSLKQYPPTASIPLILCTAATQGESYLDLQSSQIQLLEKPFDMDELLRLVHCSLPASSPNQQQ